MFSQFKYLQKDLQAYFYFLAFKIKKILSFKTSFYLQVGFMFINNAVLLLAWWLLFQTFGNINGYTFLEIVLIHGYTAVWFAIVYALFEGILDFGKVLNEDALLNYQLYPVSTLAVILARGKSLSIYGDLLWGIVLLILYVFLGGSLNFGIFLLGFVVSILGIFGLFLLFNSLLFFVSNVISLQDFIIEVFISSGFYPSTNFQGVLKTFLWIVAVFPIVSIPIETARGFLNPLNLIYTLVFAVALNLAGFWLWNKGLKLAESGSSGGLVE